MAIEYVSYKYKDAPDYRRHYATNTYVNTNTIGDILIDINEEFMEPIQVTKEVIGDENSNEYTHEFENLKVTRERKCTIVMNKAQALKMANWIINNHGQGETS